MTERATSNGYSWWWASHIRTKQSKWLEQNLQDMEDKVEHVLNLIQKDGDSFARRAEMYYKHRPEVINFVEETVRGYRSLAERYDKLSTELQKANTTIASICPEKVTYEADDDDYTTVTPSKLVSPKIPKPPKPPASKCNVLSKTKLVDQQRFDEVKLKLESLKHKFNLDQENKSHGDQMVDTIDQLVNKMLSLESSVALQTGLTDKLRQENLELQKEIQNLEAQKAAALMNVEKKVVKNEQVSWISMLLSGLEDKDEFLLQEYIAVLKSYRDTQKKLSEEKKTLSVMKSAIVKRDKSIQLLTQKLKFLQESFGEDKVDIPSINFLDDPQVIVSARDDGKPMMEFDALPDRNLDLWLSFTTLFRQVYKYKKQVKDLQEEIIKKVKSKGLDGKSSSSMFTKDLILDMKPIYKQLKEINTKVTVWLQQSALVKDQLHMINSCLLNIQEGIKFSTRDAAKLNGEILNMKQENNKVDEELEAGSSLAIVLKHEIEQTLERLEMEFGLATNQNQPRKGKSSRNTVVNLRSLLFGGKSKKQKFSLFSCLGHHRKRTRSI